MVQATNEELLAYYGATPWFAIQWHGMRATTCDTTDVHLSHGLDGTLDGKIAVLRGKVKLHNQGWSVSLAGEGSCDRLIVIKGCALLQFRLGVFSGRTPVRANAQQNRWPASCELSGGCPFGPNRER
jgi:hypothetical protein